MLLMESLQGGAMSSGCSNFAMDRINCIVTEAERSMSFAHSPTTILPRLYCEFGALADTLSTFFGGHLRHNITIVIPTEADAMTLFSDDRVRGNYRHATRELIVTNVGRSLQHELAHAYHHCQMDRIGQEHPIWVQEGLASLFEAFDADDSGTLTFLPNDRQTMKKYLITRNTFLAHWDALVTASNAQFKHEAHQYYPFARSVLEYVAAQG